MTLTPLQFRRGLRDWHETKAPPAAFATFRDVYDGLMDPASTVLSRDTKDEIEYALEIDRLAPEVGELAALLDWSDTDTDDFFRHCMTK